MIVRGIETGHDNAPDHLSGNLSALRLLSPIKVTTDTHEIVDLAVSYGHSLLSGNLEVRCITVESSNWCPGTDHMVGYTPLMMGVVGVSVYVSWVAIKFGDEASMPVLHPFEHYLHAEGVGVWSIAAFVDTESP